MQKKNVYLPKMCLLNEKVIAKRYLLKGYNSSYWIYQKVFIGWKYTYWIKMCLLTENMLIVKSRVNFICISHEGQYLQTLWKNMDPIIHYSRSWSTFWISGHYREAIFLNIYIYIYILLITPYNLAILKISYYLVRYTKIATE